MQFIKALLHAQLQAAMNQQVNEWILIPIEIIILCSTFLIQ